jgi:RimJ/RimL family protein N-acetyltransferase
MKVALRSFQPADLHFLEEWRSGIRAEQYMERLSPNAFDISGFEGWGIDYVWYVIVADGLDAGCVWVENKKNHRNIGILGIVIGSEAALGRGIGRSAIALAVQQAREVMGYDVIRLHVRQTNARAIACYERCGFLVTGEGAVSHEDLGKVPFLRMELFLCPQADSAIRIDSFDGKVGSSRRPFSSEDTS